MVTTSTAVDAHTEVQAKTPETLVTIDGLTKTFRRRGEEDVQVLTQIDLQVARGELLVLLGPSGCGKSTLLRCLAGLERPNRGRIALGDTEFVNGHRGTFLPPNKRDVGMVFQNYALWPHLKVSQNVAYPLKAKRRKDALKEGRVEEALKVVHCDHLAERYPPELSGGQQQRVALARAMASRPSLMLLDEPLSNLDALLRIELRSQLRLLHRELGFTAIHVTHDQEEAIALGTRVAVMNAGRIEQIGPPNEVYENPATGYVADFLGARNRLEVDIDATGDISLAGHNLGIQSASGVTGRHSFRVRDLHLKVRLRQDCGNDSEVAWLPAGTLTEVVPGTERFECVVDFEGTRLFASVRNGAEQLSPGDPIDIGIDPQRTLCYDAAERLVTDWYVNTGRSAS